MLEASEDVQGAGLVWCTYNEKLQHVAVKLFCPQLL